MSKTETSSSGWGVWSLGVGGACIVAGALGIFYAAKTFRSRGKPPKKRPPSRKKSVPRRESIKACSKETYLDVLDALIDRVKDMLDDISKMEESIRRQKPYATRQEISELLNAEYDERMKRVRAQVFSVNSTTEQACAQAHDIYRKDSDVSQKWERLTELEKKIKYTH